LRFRQGDIFTSSSNSKMDDQKWSALGRGAYSFGQEERWFAFAQTAVDHDRFSDIDIRTAPSAGLGYWLLKQETFKWSVEGGLGYEITNYRSAKSTKKTMIGVGKTHLEKAFFQKSKIIEDFTILPSLEGEGYRINNQIEFTNPINDTLSLSVKYITDYNSKPAPDTKKMDGRLVTGVKYSF
jgi:putative salt-induced outer membrane protein YdiY